MADFEREPIFWTATTPGYNLADRQRTTVRNGRRVVEKVPQHGHAGDYEERRLAPGVRSVRMIDHHGHEIFLALTNAAAHLDHTTPYGQHMLSKARAFGWFQPSQCPCALLATGEMHPDCVMSDEVREAAPCAPGSYSYEKPCPHAVAERATRRAESERVQADREAAFKSTDDKMLEALREQTAALTAAQSAALAAATRSRKGDQ